jgi:integrase
MIKSVKGKDEIFNKYKRLVEELPEDANKKLLKKYVLWHQNQIDSNNMSYSSVCRSLQIALNICDNIPNINKLEVAPLERFWVEQSTRKTIRKTQGKILMGKNNLKPGSLQKINSQIIKLYKFAYFLNKYPDKPIELFKTSLMQKPDCCTFLFVNKSKKREDFNLPSQEKVKELIEHLFKTKYYYAKMAATITAIANDCGLRFSEIVTLKRKDIKLVDDFYLISVSESKTAKRTVLCKLAKKFLDEWFKISPKTELVFEPLLSEKGMVIGYNSVRKYLISSAEKVGVELPSNKSFHLFRHCASSRLRDMPSNQKRYFMGWRQDEMENIYTRVGWEDCKESYFKSLKNNPMVDFTLSEYEETIKSQKDILKKMVEDILTSKNML